MTHAVWLQTLRPVLAGAILICTGSTVCELALLWAVTGCLQVLYPVALHRKVPHQELCSIDGRVRGSGVVLWIIDAYGGHIHELT